MSEKKVERAYEARKAIWAVILSYYIYDEVRPEMLREVEHMDLKLVREQLVHWDRENYCEAIRKAREYLLKRGVDLREPACEEVYG